MSAPAEHNTRLPRAPVQQAKKIVRVVNYPDRKQLYRQIPDDMNTVFTELQDTGIALEKALMALNVHGKVKSNRASPRDEYNRLTKVILEIERHALQRALPPRYGCWPKEAIPVGCDLYQHLIKTMATFKADGRTILTSSELSVVQEKFFAFLKGLNPQIKLPKYTPGVPIVEADFDS